MDLFIALLHQGIVIACAIDEKCKKEKKKSTIQCAELPKQNIWLWMYVFHILFQLFKLSNNASYKIRLASLYM